MSLISILRSAFSSGRLDVRSRFELLREAISGTMSKFYMAKDRRTGRIVGLKILDREKTAAFEARFKGLGKPSEGAIAVQFRHPNIVQTYEHGLTTDNAPYLVMEYLPGPGIHALLADRDERLATHRLEFIRQAAAAVAEVHNVGFLHRDICPRNLILASDGETVKLIDFGLAIPATEPFFRPGNRTGNPNYMAPEIVRRRPTDHRVDVFAFGVTAYEILAGTLPWTVGTTGQAAMSHETEPTDLRQHVPQIHPELARLIHACIEPEPDKRPNSMEEVLRRLKPISS